MNIGNWRMLVLTLAVGAGIFAPIPDAHFYAVCVLVECFVAASAIIIEAPASKLVFRVSMMLVLFHFLGWWLDGYPPESPYHLLVKILEHAELVACILMSTLFLGKQTDA
ncbi:hypothetical protein [Pseudomonas sp.]|uniref:hypothetical protein n=1 Tax=Pseudomonas sp. TaxID=306 RepID=UPI003FD7C4BB